MRLFVTAAVLGTALITASASEEGQSRRSASLERPFVANGRISMDLSAGEYRITASPDNRIGLRWSVRDANQLPRVVARADVRGPEANITTDAPSNSSFKVAIEVPAHVDLYVRLTAGELTVERILGNKDIALHAGEIDIDVGNPEDYRRVEASVWAGELHAAPYGLSKEGLFRSVDWSGKGPYRLAAHLKAGELWLRSHGSDRLKSSR